MAGRSLPILGLISVLVAGTGASVVKANQGKTGPQLSKYSSCSCDYVGASVATSGPTTLVGVPAIDDATGRAYVDIDQAEGWSLSAVLQGSDSEPGDTFGFSLAVSGTTAVVGAPGHADYAGSAYVFSDSGGSWAQVAELVGSDTVAGDWFGAAVAIDGTNVIVGAPVHAGAGSAYVFTDAGGSWTQASELTGAVPGGYFGYAVGLSGATAIVGAPADPAHTGNAFVFSGSGAAWSLVATLSGTGTGVHDFGSAVAVDGSTAAVGAWIAKKGAAYVFSQTGSGWSQAAALTTSDNRIGFGAAAAVSGSTVVVTAVGGSGNGGRAYVYTPSGTTWTQSAELAPAGTEGGDFFGNRSVSISGTTIVVGAPDHGAVGNAFVFTNSGGSWSQVADLANSDGTTGDATGSSVAISSVATIAGAPGHVGIGRVYLFPTPPPWHPIIGIEAPDTAVGSDFGASLGVTGTTVIVGAPGNSGAGSAYVFPETIDAPYTQAAVRAPSNNYVYERPAELEGSDTSTGDAFGASVAIAGTIAVVGAPGHGGTGSAYVFSETGNTWSQVAELEGSDTATGDDFGAAVSISGTNVVVGAPRHGGTGSAYVFTASSGSWIQGAELDGSDTSTGDDFGTSVAISGLTAVVGAPGHAGTGGAYVFDGTSGWTQTAELNGADSAAGDDFGAAVGVAGAIAVVGSPEHGGIGSAYVFTQASSSWSQTVELKGSGTAAGNHFGAAVAIVGTKAVVGAPNNAGTGAAYVFTV